MTIHHNRFHHDLHIFKSLFKSLSLILFADIVDMTLSIFCSFIIFLLPHIFFKTLVCNIFYFNDRDFKY